jgi:predicted NBD/HSP70 family sugar kinase
MLSEVVLSFFGTESVKTNRINGMRLLGLVKEREKISRTTLAKITGLSLAAVSRLVQQLIEDGWVTETGYGDSAGGRRPVFIEPNPKTGYIIGIDFERSKTRGVVFDFSGNIQFFHKAVIKNRDFFTGLFEVIDACMNFLTENGLNEKLLGIGIGVRGFLDIEKGTILSSIGFSWSNIPLKQILTDRYKVPIFMDLNARLAALGEWSLIYHRSVSDLTYVTASWGICAGIISGGSPFYGSSGSTGEIGLSVLHYDGNTADTLEKRCGGQMFLKTISEEWDSPHAAFVRDLCENNLENLELEMIIDAAQRGNVFCENLACTAGAVLGTGLANLVVCFNPRVLVLGGHLAEVTAYRDAASKTLYKFLPQEMHHQFKLEKSVLGNMASMYGASIMVFQSLFPYTYHPEISVKPVSSLQKQDYEERISNFVGSLS